MTSDDRIVEYLRVRGRERPPPAFVSSVMRAVDAAPEPRSRFSTYLPAFMAAGAVAVIALLALLIGPVRDVGPAPTPRDAAPSSTPSTLADLETAVRAATERLAAAPAVEGLHTHTVEGYLASATWFDWRPSGDVVVVTRTDIDVSAPWWTDPDGEPLSVGERIDTDMWVIVGNTAYAAREEAWLALSPADAPRVLNWGTGMLSGEIPPLGWIDPGSDALVSRRAHDDGGEAWRIEIADEEDTRAIEWRIGSDGRLSSYTVEGYDVTFEPTVALKRPSARTVIEFTPVDRPDPIQPPDPDAVPDPLLFGLPDDFPLAEGEMSAMDYRAYVEDVLGLLEAYHWNSAAIDWAAARSAALDGLPNDPPMDQAHARIRTAITSVDPFATVFIAPRDVPPDGADGEGQRPGQLPSADRIGDAGYLALPAPEAFGADALREYLRTARLGMAAVEASEPACGWIVDLRDYDAGGWGPPLWAIGGLLSEGRIITFSNETAEWWLEIDAEGRLSSEEFDASDEPVDSPYIERLADAERDEALLDLVESELPYRPTIPEPPVAVLVSNATARGGEQALVAFLGRPSTRVFGAPTGGMPIVTPTYHLADGAQLRVPAWIPADRDGTQYTGNITPDEVVGDTRPLGSDAIRDAALDWLGGQPGCS